MSSNIRIEKICLFCKTSFEARTTVTKYCSLHCARKAYKINKRQANIDSVVETVHQEKRVSINLLQEKEYLSIAETAQLFGISTRTIQRLLKSGVVGCAKLGKRTILRRKDFDALFTFKTVEQTDKTEPIVVETYSVAEIEEKYGIKYSRLNAILKQKKIPHERIKGRLRVSKIHTDRYFQSRRMDTNKIIDWYSVEEAQIKHGLSKDQVYRRVSENKIPKKHEGKFVKISKVHFDRLFNLTP